MPASSSNQHMQQQLPLGRKQLDVPQHVQQWLSSLQHNMQPSIGQHLDHPAIQAQTPLPQQMAANHALHAEVLQLKAELKAVQARFADAQVQLMLFVLVGTGMSKSLVMPTHCLHCPNTSLSIRLLWHVPNLA